MGATFSSGTEVEVSPAAAAGGDDKKLWNDDLVDSYVFVVDAVEVDVPRAAATGGEEKTMWPELVGMKGSEAAHAILQDRHDVTVHHYGRKAPPPGFDPKRVVLFSDSRLRVVSIPMVG